MRSDRDGAALALPPLPPIKRGELNIPARPAHLSPWTRPGLAGACYQVAILTEKRTPPLLVATLPTDKADVPVYTEVPEHKGQPVQVIDSSSDEEEEGRGPVDNAAASGGHPAGDERKTSKAPSTPRTSDVDIALAAPELPEERCTCSGPHRRGPRLFRLALTPAGDAPRVPATKPRLEVMQ